MAARSREANSGAWLSVAMRKILMAVHNLAGLRRRASAGPGTLPRRHQDRELVVCIVQVG
jgi:hypothetical protein